MLTVFVIHRYGDRWDADQFRVGESRFLTGSKAALFTTARAFRDENPRALIVIGDSEAPPYRADDSQWVN